LIKGDFAAALDLIRKEIGKNPVSPDLGALRLLEARILRAQGDRAGSESSYRAATEDPVWAEPAVEELHEMMIERGEFDRSEELLTWAVGRVLEPTIGLLRGRSLFTQGRFHAAFAAIDSTRGPTSSEELDAERRLLEANTRLVLGHVDPADSLFDGLLSESKDLRIKALAHYGKAQVARQRGARAIRVLEDERALTEWNAPWALLDAAIALRELGRTQESEQKLEALVRSAPYLDVPAELLMSNLSDEAGKSEDAKEILAGLLRGNLSDPLAMANLGDINLRERRSEEGLFLLRSAAEAVPDFAPFRQRLMRAWIDRGQKPDPGFEPILWDVNLVSAGEDLIEGNLPYFGVIADRDSMPPADPRRLVMALTFAVSGNAGTVIGWTEGATAATPGLSLVRAFALHQVGRKDEALLVLEDLARDGKESWLSEELRLKLLYPDRRDQAEEIAKKILDARPRDARFRMRLSRLREDAQDLEGAIVLLREARNAGWLTVAEKRKLRDRLDDLEDLARSKGEGTEGAMKEGVPKEEPSENEPREETPREDEQKEEPGESRS
jgi:tetratricopeptide (TPR) repeat protein